MNSKEILQFANSFSLFSNDLFNRFRTKNSMTLLRSIMKKTCRSKNEKVIDLQKQYIVQKYTQGKLSRSDLERPCSLNKKIKILFNELYFSQLVDQNKYKTAFNFLAQGTSRVFLK